MEPETTEERWKKADELIAAGYTLAEISRQTRVSYTATRRYLKRSGRYELWKARKKKKTPEIPEDIENMVLETVRRYKTVNAWKIEEHTQLGWNLIGYILRKHKIDSDSHHHLMPIPIVLDGPFQERPKQCEGYTKQQRNIVLETILDKDPITLHQLQEGTGQEKETLLSILKDEQLVYLIPTQNRNLELDQRIAAGDTLEEIGAARKVTKERVRQYINATGQYDYWKEQRKRRKAEKSKQENNLHQTRQELTNVLISRAYQKADEGGWKYRRKALDYYYGGLKGKEKKYINAHYVTTPLEKILLLFETYEMAERLKVKLSLQELEERTGIYFTLIGRILESQGLEPLYGARERSSPLSSEKVQAIEGAYGLEFTSSDVAYFLGLSETPWIVTQHFVEIRRSGAKKRMGKPWLFQKGRRFNRGIQKGDHLFYRTASQIYELDDLAREENINFPDDEVARLFEIRPECVEYARKNRGWIEYDIKRLLRVLYPERKGEKPYL